MRARQRRIWTLAVSALLLLAAAALAFVALEDNADLFYTPGVLAEQGAPEPGKSVKVGGIVQRGSLEYGGGALMEFLVEDGTGHTIRVAFDGVAPDLFREGQGVVATGAFDTSGRFSARTLLAKHDEEYRPRELEDIEIALEG